MAKITLLLSLIVSISATGEWEQMCKDCKETKKLAVYSTKHISFASNSIFHSKLIEILDAKKQVVAGFNYELIINIGTTVCRKNNTSFEEAQNCSLQTSGYFLTCVANVWERLWLLSTEVTEFRCSPIAYLRMFERD
uniref:Cystatin n=1 Tax=Hadrurus spadix TaxID=141984 RepID=A0A1W7RAP2_9SCOR